MDRATLIWMLLGLLLGLAHAQDPPPPPIAPPAAPEGCVSAEVADAYEARLEALAEKSLTVALGSDVTRETRSGFLVDPGREPDTEYAVDSKRFAFLGSWDARAEPSITLARVGSRLHRVVPEPTAWDVPLTVCGPNPCPMGGGARVHVRALAIELAEGETVGPPLAPTHDSWWVLRDYTASRHCLPQP